MNWSKWLDRILVIIAIPWIIISLFWLTYGAIGGLFNDDWTNFISAGRWAATGFIVLVGIRVLSRAIVWVVKGSKEPPEGKAE